MTTRRFRLRVFCQAAEGGGADIARADSTGRDPRHQCERGQLRGELLNGEIFYSLAEP
jgi:hypothetical protein